MKMAGEGDERRRWRRSRRTMDLNLYLGLPLSPLPHIPDLGSDLALGSVSPPLPIVDMVDSRTPYSPSHASFAHENIVVEEVGGNPTSPDNSRYVPSSSFNLQFPSSTLPLQSVVVFPYSPAEVGNEAASQVPHTLPSVGSADESMGRDEDETLLFCPYDHPLGLTSTSPHQDHSEMEPHRPTLLQMTNDVAGQDGDGGGSSSRQDAPRRPEFRFHNLIESDQRSRTRNREVRRFRSSLPCRDRIVALGAAPFTAPEQNLRAALAERPLENPGKSKVNENGVNNDGLEGQEEEKTEKTTNFDCNICYDVAKEPVVTSCGHLFCWPCLYQWLHHYSDHKECPACKGQVIEANITPIYGRGLSKDADEVKIGDYNVESDLKIPPRPCGRRFESLRQRMRRPISGRPGEGAADISFWPFDGEGFLNMDRLEGLTGPTLNDRVAGRLDGVSNPPRHYLDEAVQADGHLIHPTQQQFVGHASRLVDRFRSPRSLATDGREPGLIPVSGISRVAAASTRRAVANHGSSDTDASRRFSLHMAASDRLDALHMLFTTFSRNSSHPRPSTFRAHRPRNPQVPSSPANPQNLNLFRRPVQSADQASASTTMAVTQHDYVGVPDTSVEPNRSGPSSSSRSVRGGGNASGIFDVDGVLHPNKRRRLN